VKKYHTQRKENSNEGNCNFVSYEVIVMLETNKRSVTCCIKTIDYNSETSIFMKIIFLWFSW